MPLSDEERKKRRRERDRKYREKNREKLNERARKWQKENREKNTEKIREVRKKYQEKNREKINNQRWEAAQEKKLLNKNTHDICRLVGTPFTNQTRHKIRCTYCLVAYTDKDLKENYFVRKYRCPCCKKVLKTFRSKQYGKSRV